MNPDEPLRVNIHVHTTGEFDANYIVWLINPDDPEDHIDVIFEDEELARCLSFCERMGYEVNSYPGMEVPSAVKSHTDTDTEFCEAVWGALKGDHNDLRREQIILQAHRKVTSDHEELLTRLQGEISQLRSALEHSVVAIDDWLNTYADDLCDPVRVAEARSRIGQYGTIGYISEIQQKNRTALKACNND